MLWTFSTPISHGDGQSELARGREDDPPNHVDAALESGDKAGLVGDRRFDRAGGIHQRPHAGARLETALASAPARRPAGAQRNVTELAGAEPIALEQLAVEDDPGPDATPDPDDDEVVRPRPAIEGELRERGGVAVVRHDDRHAGSGSRRGARAGGRPSRGSPTSGRCPSGYR
jgi:hypothetical protein